MKTAHQVERFLVTVLDKWEGSDEIFAPDLIMRDAGLNQSDQDAVVGWMKTFGEVRVESESADGTAYLIRLTRVGLERAVALRERSRSKAQRDVYLHNVLLRFAYQHSPAGGSVSLQLFAEEDGWWFGGTEVTWDEVFAAVDFLEHEGLLAVDRIVGDQQIRPTHLGSKFARSNVTLRTFMSTQQPHNSGVTHHYSDSVVVHGGAPGSNLATGGGNTQTVNNGVDADALASLVTQLREVAPTLELSQEDEEDLVEEIDTLERQGADVGMARRSWRRIKRIVGPVALTVGTEHAVQAAIAGGTALLG